jgi:toluene monooxygenase system ferredoxin subunit
MAFRRVESLVHLWIGEVKGVVVDGVPVVLVHLPDGVHAFEDRCAHQAARMSEGRIEGDVFVCGAHGWCYDARSGCGVNPESARLRAFPVRVEEGAVWVDVAGGRR